MKNFYVPPQFEVVRDPQRCVNCKVCVEQCPNGVHRFDETHGRMLADESKCVDCQRCVAYCPTHALKIEKNRCTLRESANWSSDAVEEIWKQAATGGVLLSSMGSPKELPVYWDRLLLNASQVTNPPIDALREKIVTSTTVYVGAQGNLLEEDADNCKVRAHSRMQNSVSSELSASITGYNSVSTLSENISIDYTAKHYALLPVWMLHTKWQGKDYLFAMNGQTGKLVGDLPVDKRKVAAWFAGISVPLMILLAILL